MINEYTPNLKCDYIDKKAALKGEVERQLIHLFTGITLIFLIWAAGNMALNLLLFLLISDVTISVSIMLGKLPLPLSSFLCRWGRPSRQTMPFEGTILLLCGATFSLILFPEEIVYASIAVVAVGDSIATAAGVLAGRHKLPYSGDKTVEGTVSGTIAAFFCGFTFCNSCSGFCGGCRWHAIGKRCRFTNNPEI